MKKEFWLAIFLAIIIVALAAVLLWPTPTKNQKNTLGIQIITPKLGEAVSSPIKISGSVNGGGWGGFEGQVGGVTLLDYKGNIVATGPLSATTDWTRSPTSFETTLTFQTKTTGPMTLLFHNENASGDPVRNKTFTLPIIVK